jgi:prevent-host-death family protein
MGTIIRPSADLRNHYSEISKLVRESRNTVVITVNGRGDTAVIGLQEYNQMTAELELLRSLAEADDDVKNGRIAPIQNSFDDLRATLLKRKNG